FLPAGFLVLVVLPELPVVHDDDRLDQAPRAFAAGLVHQALGAPPIEPEAAGDQHQQTSAEQKSALSLETGLAKDTFERAIRHAAGFPQLRFPTLYSLPDRAIKLQEESRPAGAREGTSIKHDVRRTDGQAALVGGGHKAGQGSRSGQRGPNARAC